MSFASEAWFSLPIVLTWITLILDFAVKLLLIYTLLIGIKALKKYINN